MKIPKYLQTLEAGRFSLDVYSKKLKDIEQLVLHKKDIPDYIIKLKVLVKLLNSQIDVLQKIEYVKETKTRNTELLKQDRKADIVKHLLKN